MPPDHAPEIAGPGDSTNVPKDDPLSNHPNRGRGRPRDPNGKRNKTYRLSPDVIAAIDASEKSADDFLRERVLG